jgi:hypothetical protein
MKFGNIAKSAEVTVVTEDMLKKINLYTRKELSADDVYVFPVVMCDNELDRDYDKFTVTALNEFAELFKGKTVICDHIRRNANQCARIFDTEVIHTPSVKTFDGEDLYQLTGMAYMLKNESNAETIANIDAGIYKEVSVGCMVKKTLCSVCGKDYYGGECQHWRGGTYEGKTCFTKLDGASDAYELSFVAVPAQPGAGITKWYDGDETVKKGSNKGMNYEEMKKSLAELGVDLDSIAKTKGEIPEMSVILAAIKGKRDEDIAGIRAEASKSAFLTADTVKSAIGKDMTSDEVIAFLKASSETAEKAKLYDGIKSKAIDEAVKSGIKAKGDAFDENRYKKLFESFSIDEVNAQAKDWDEDAKKTLNAGGRKSEDEAEKSVSLSIDINNYKL